MYFASIIIFYRRKMKCFECGSKAYTTITGETICQSCGLVLDDKPVDQGFSFRRNEPVRLKAGTKQDGRIVKDIWLLSSREKNIQKGYNPNLTVC
jgi:hypothetical protein